ncbi:MAG: hypothetical protein M0R46_10105 [Candidatus Muirbacterium halophilum]|nr:hypothetical protein [Candidatus Muirbacterium halophilum]
MTKVILRSELEGVDDVMHYTCRKCGFRQPEFVSLFEKTYKQKSGLCEKCYEKINNKPKRKTKKRYRYVCSVCRIKTKTTNKTCGKAECIKTLQLQTKRENETKRFHKEFKKIYSEVYNGQNIWEFGRGKFIVTLEDNLKIPKNKEEIYLK